MKRWSSCMVGMSFAYPARLMKCWLGSLRETVVAPFYAARPWRPHGDRSGGSTAVSCPWAMPRSGRKPGGLFLCYRATLRA